MSTPGLPRLFYYYYPWQGQPKKCISAQRDMMDFKGGIFCF